MDRTNADAFSEALKDLVDLYFKVTGHYPWDN